MFIFLGSSLIYHGCLHKNIPSRWYWKCRTEHEQSWNHTPGPGREKPGSSIHASLKLSKRSWLACLFLFCFLPSGCFYDSGGGFLTGGLSWAHLKKSLESEPLIALLCCQEAAGSDPRLLGTQFLFSHAGVKLKLKPEKWDYALSSLSWQSRTG